MNSRRTPLRLAGIAVLSAALAALAAGPTIPPDPRAAPAAPAAHAQGAGRAWVRTAVWPASYDAGALLQPGGVDAGPGGTFFVADRGHDRVAVVDAAGTIVRAFGQRGVGAGQLIGPSDVAADLARDRVYVVDRGNKRIAVFTLAGAPVRTWQHAGPDHGLVPQAVAVAPSGDVYVLNATWGRVEHFTPDGAWRAGWGDTGSGRGRLQGPEDLAVDAGGRVLVADTNNDRIQVFGALDTGTVESIIPLRDVAGVAVDRASGRVYGLHYGASPRAMVTVFGPSGAVETTLPSGAPDPFAPGVGIAVGNGRLALTTAEGAADGRQGLRQYTLPGLAPAATTLANPTGHAGFLRPLALDVGPDHSVYLVDGGLRLARRYAPDGAFRERLDNGAGTEIGVGPTGELFVADTPLLGDVRLRRLSAAGARMWDKVCDCLSGSGVAATDSRIYATNAFRQRIDVFDMAESRRDPIAQITIADPPYAWPLDLDLGPDGRLYVAGGANGRIDVLDPAGGAPRGGWSVGEGNGAERISVGADGTVYALLFDGTIAAYTPDGALEHAWRPDPAPGARVAAPRDLAGGPDGRLYVADAASDAVLVYDASGIPQTPTPTPTPQSPCTTTGTKTAAPTRVALGEPVTIELTLNITCRPGSEPRADIVLILDRSNSMAGDKLTRARSAARSFVQGLDLARHRVAVVSFSDLVTLEQPLTGDGAAVQAILDGIRHDGRTDIASALDVALRHVAEAGRPGALPVLLLMTDGKPSREGQPYVDAVRLGERARARGALTYAIGLGDPNDVDGVLLTEIAGAAARYFYAPRPEDLDPIYRQLSQTIGGVTATNVEVTDELGPDVDYVPGSAVPAAELRGRQLVWAVGVLPAGGVRLRLQVTPRRTGRLPTNTEAVARYTADNARFAFTYPIPEIVVGAAPTATPTRRPPRPTVAYLPFLSRNLCLPKDSRLGADIMLVIDTSSSMDGGKLAAAILAAQGFIEQVDARRDRVGLVSFAADARREYVLTSDLAAVSRALGGMLGGVGTRIDRGLEEALLELDRRARADSPRVIVLLSDGVPAGGSEERTRRLAFEARASGVTVFTVGLGTDADGPFLRGLARSPAHYAFAPSPGDLTGIYRRIAASLPCPGG